MINIPIDGSLSLRQVTEDDAEPIFQLINASRGVLSAWMPFVRNTKGSQDTLAYIHSAMRDGQKCLVCGIVENGNLVGMCGFNEISEPNRSANIGYWLGIKFLGRGIMERSVKALVDYGFSQMGLNRIAISCATGNFRSAKVAVKCGFLLEGVSREAECINGVFVDHRNYSRLRND